MNQQTEKAICGKCLDVVVLGRRGFFNLHDERQEYLQRINARGGKKILSSQWQWTAESDLVSSPFRCVMCETSVRWGSGFPVEESNYAKESK